MLRQGILDINNRITKIIHEIEHTPKLWPKHFPIAEAWLWRSHEESRQDAEFRKSLQTHSVLVAVTPKLCSQRAR